MAFFLHFFLLQNSNNKNRWPWPWSIYRDIWTFFCVIFIIKSAKGFTCSVVKSTDIHDTLVRAHCVWWRSNICVQQLWLCVFLLGQRMLLGLTFMRTCYSTLCLIWIVLFFPFFFWCHLRAADRNTNPNQLRDERLTDAMAVFTEVCRRLTNWKRQRKAKGKWSNSKFIFYNIRVHVEWFSFESTFGIRFGSSLPVNFASNWNGTEK